MKRKITQDDINAAARGLRMASLDLGQLQSLVNIHGGSKLFAGQVIAAAAKQMIKVKRSMGTKNPRKTRRLSLSNIARVHQARRAVIPGKISRPGYEAFIKQEKARLRRKRQKRNPSLPVARGLFFVQIKRGDIWKSYAACDTLDRAKVVAKALAHAERAPVRVTDKPNEG